MRTYLFQRPCGHVTRGKRKALALARPCLYCATANMEGKTPEEAARIEREFLALDLATLRKFKSAN